MVEIVPDVKDNILFDILVEISGVIPENYERPSYNCYV